jgi:hypothetical protein
MAETKTGHFVCFAGGLTARSDDNLDLSVVDASVAMLETMATAMVEGKGGDGNAGGMENGGGGRKEFTQDNLAHVTLLMFRNTDDTAVLYEAQW